jgi:uncharacterized membrane protein
MAGNALEVARKAKPSSDQLTSPKGLAAAGAALIALPYAAKGIAKLGGGTARKIPEKASELSDRATQKATAKAKDVAGDVADAKLKPSLPGPLDSLFGGGDESDDDSDSDGGSAADGVGSGRRMPIQQSVDVAVPIGVAYDLWTGFEDWPSFMHRVDSAEQVDDATVAFSVKVWGITKRFEAEITEQRPDERIEWDVSQGLAHTGVATFHKLAPRLTRIEVTVDVQPDSLLEKFGRGARFAKRAVRGDLHRFKAYAEIEGEAEHGGWRGTIEDGKVKRKTQRKSSSSSSNKKGTSRKSSSRSRNGGDPSSRGSRKSGSRS